MRTPAVWRCGSDSNRVVCRVRRVVHSGSRWGQAHVHAPRSLHQTAWVHTRCRAMRVASRRGEWSGGHCCARAAARYFRSASTLRLIRRLVLSEYVCRARPSPVCLCVVRCDCRLVFGSCMCVCVTMSLACARSYNFISRARGEFQIIQIRPHRAPTLQGAAHASALARRAEMEEPQDQLAARENGDAVDACRFTRPDM